MLQRLLPFAASVGALAATLNAGDPPLSSYGTGTPGTGGVTPRQWATDKAWTGNAAFALTVDRGLPASLAFPVLSLAPQNASFGGVQFNVDLAVSASLPLLVLDGAGAGSSLVPIPNSPIWLGFELFAQTFVLDTANVGSLPFSSTPGLRFTIGRPPLLVVPRSGTGNLPVGIDVSTGTQTVFASSAIGGSTCARLSADGTRAFVTNRTPQNEIAIYDVLQSPPARVGGFATQPPNPYPWSAQLTPDGRRLYVVNDGSNGSTPIVEVMDADPASPGFGQAFPGGSMGINGAKDAGNIVFRSDGRRAYLSILGLFAGPGRVEEYDTDPASPTYHQHLRTIGFPAWAYFVAISPDDRWLVVSLTSLNAPTEVAVVDVQTFQLVDADPLTPGQQNLGAQQSGPPTQFPFQLVCIEFDPRGGVVYMSGYDRVCRLVVDPQDPAFGTLTTSTSGFVSGATNAATGIAVNASGTRFYATLRMSGWVVEYASDTLQALRTWNVGTFAGRLDLR